MSALNLEHEVAAAEKRGYAKGYAAGKRRLASDMTREELQAERDAFWRQALLAAMPACIEAQGWTRGDKPIADIPSRMMLAANFADEALKRLRL